MLLTVILVLKIERERIARGDNLFPGKNTGLV